MRDRCLHPLCVRLVDPHPVLRDVPPLAWDSLLGRAERRRPRLRLDVGEYGFHDLHGARFPYPVVLGLPRPGQNSHGSSDA